MPLEIIAAPTGRAPRGVSLSAARGTNRNFRIFSDIAFLQRELRDQFGKRAGGQLTLANTRAMNSAIRPSKTAAKREIARARNLPPKRVDSRLQIVPATADRQTVMLKGRGFMIPLTRLKGGESNPKQFSRGVKVTAERGKRTLVEKAFLAKGRQGLQVFQRSRIGGGPKRESRLPIQALTVPSIAHTLVEETTVAKVLERYEEAYVNAYGKQLRNAIRRAQKRIEG